MSQKPITIHLSDELYDRVREAAEASERSVEEVLLESIGVIFEADTDFPQRGTNCD